MKQREDALRPEKPWILNLLSQRGPRLFQVQKDENNFPGGSDRKESAHNAGDRGAIPGVGRSPGRGCDNPLQYSDLENPHGQRSLAGYSPWGCKDSDATERPSPASMAAVDIGPALVCEAATCYRGKLKHRLSNLPKATQLGGSSARN